jgi:hypothetical protein
LVATGPTLAPLPVTATVRAVAAAVSTAPSQIARFDRPDPLPSPTASAARTEQLPFLALRARQSYWTDRLTRLLVQRHVAKQVEAGWRGALGVAAVVAVLLRVAAQAAFVGVVLAAADALEPARSWLAGGLLRLSGKGGGRGGRAAAAPGATPL